jgi:hypothetical protein
MNKGFPVPRESSGDYLDEDQSVVCRFVYEELFPNVVVVLQQSPVLGPPPVDVILGQDASGQDFIIKRRKLSYLGNIVRSWQRSVRLPTTMVTVPMIQPVRDALVSTALTFIHYKHHKHHVERRPFRNCRTSRCLRIIGSERLPTRRWFCIIPFAGGLIFASNPKTN